MPDPDGEGKELEPGNSYGNSNSAEVPKGIAGRTSSTTARDLKVVENIESSAGSRGGTHIHIFKSRELTNAKNYAKKIGSILALHGYSVVDLTNGNSDSEKGSRGISIYIVDENFLESIRKEKNLQFPVRISQLIGSSKIGQNGSADVIVALSDAYHANVFPERSESFPEVHRATGESKKSSIDKSNRSKRNDNLPFLLFGFAVLLPLLLTTLEEYSSTFGINIITQSGLSLNVDIGSIILAVSSLLSLAGLAMLAFRFSVFSFSYKILYLLSVLIFIGGVFLVASGLISPVVTVSSLNSAPVFSLKDYAITAASIYSLKVMPALLLTVGNTGRRNFVASILLVVIASVVIGAAPAMISYIPAAVSYFGQSSQLYSIYYTIIISSSIPSLGYVPFIQTSLPQHPPFLPPLLARAPPFYVNPIFLSISAVSIILSLSMFLSNLKNTEPTVPSFQFRPAKNV